MRLARIMMRKHIRGLSLAALGLLLAASARRIRATAAAPLIPTETGCNVEADVSNGTFKTGS